MDSSNQPQRGGRGGGRGGRGGRNHNKPQDAAAPAKHVDPTAAVAPAADANARPPRDRRERRGVAKDNSSPNNAENKTTDAAPQRAEGRQERGGRRGGRGGRGGRGAASDEVASSENPATSFSVTSSAPQTTPSTAAATPSTGGTSFEKLGLIPELIAATVKLGYKGPTPIQQQAIPQVLNGKDVLAGAQTGTGKTAAFSLPILQLLNKKYIVNNKAPEVRGGAPLRVLVLTPTRELAAQVHDNIRDLSQNLNRSFFSSTVIVGGVSQGQQVAELKKRPTILVATPGRLLDFHNQGGIVDLSTVEFCVLDEADRMLDMGFYPDVSKILALLPKKKQSLLFSATFTPDIRNLAGKILHSPIAEVQVTPPNSTVERIQQSYYLVGRNSKDEALAHIIQTNKWDQVLVFTRTKGGANQVSSMLSKRNITALALHGGKSQTARTTALADFKSGKLRVLVATDIAARGLDIEDLPHVVNYELPNVPEDYVHRIGRTGRAGKEGFAISLVSLDEEGFLNNILKFAGKADIPLKKDIPAAFGPPADEKAQPIALGQMTLWGGAGPMPPKSVMDAAGKEKRREIATAIRERKQGERDARDAKATRQNNGGGRGGQQQQQPKQNHQSAPSAGGRGGRGGAQQQQNGNNGGGRGGAQQQQNNGGRGGRGGLGDNQNNGGYVRGGRGAPRGGRGQ